MKKLLSIFIILFTVNANAQQFYTDLFGFRIGQYREAAKTQLGKPFKSGKFDDGFEYEAFPLKPDRSLYIVFEYAAKATDVIWSIQVSGSDIETDLGFKNARLGTDKAATEKVFGKPSSIENIGEYGDKWNYAKTNLSVEVNKKGKFSSIKINNNSQELFPKGPDVKAIPAFDKVRKILISGDNAAILNILAGDVEVYNNHHTYYFKKSFINEQNSDYSKTLSVIKSISKDLAKVNVKDPNEFEENMRLTLGDDIKHVIKLKKNHQVKEIVLKYFAGKYYIFEIKADS
ncbi:MAG: hypothetical protein H7289_11150 [Mucilaginibacter sp.]|nr:hypothetical protein [Mucilaginibacter sp.]